MRPATMTAALALAGRGSYAGGRREHRVRRAWTATTGRVPDVDLLAISEAVQAAYYDKPMQIIARPDPLRSFLDRYILPFLGWCGGQGGFQDVKVEPLGLTATSEAGRTVVWELRAHGAKREAAIDRAQVVLLTDGLRYYRIEEEPHEAAPFILQTRLEPLMNSRNLEPLWRYFSLGAFSDQAERERLEHHYLEENRGGPRRLSALHVVQVGHDWPWNSPSLPKAAKPGDDCVFGEPVSF